MVLKGWDVAPLVDGERTGGARQTGGNFQLSSDDVMTALLFSLCVWNFVLFGVIDVTRC